MLLQLVETLRQQHDLTDRQYRALLTTRDQGVVAALHHAAREVAQQHFGQGVFVRGLIELSNVCRNNCLYCGIRCGNHHVERYTLTQQQVLECCEVGHELGFRTFVLQGGEWDEKRSPWIAQLVQSIKLHYSDCAVTLSLGEHDRDTYALWRDAGADRYLLRHETSSARHYSLLHPHEMTLSHRMQCIEWLMQLGYQVGTGIMVGSPFQTLADMVSDVRYITRLRPQMVGLGPFIPHHDTPLHRFPAGSIDMTTRLYSIIRLALPNALIPSTTALATLTLQGRCHGILAGANVVMPNLSPLHKRAQYTLYDNKATTGAESAQGIKLLQQELTTIGYHIDWSRGDYAEK